MTSEASRSGAAGLGRRLLLRSRPQWRVHGISAGCVAIAFVARLALVPLIGVAAPFFTFALAVLVASVWVGAIGGLSAVILSSLIVDVLWLPPTLSFQLSGDSWGRLAAFWMFSGALIAFSALIRALVRALSLAEERANILALEMTHRMRNVLGLVQTISRQTFRGPQAAPEYQRSFEARLVALGRAQELVADHPETPTDLRELLNRVIEPFGAARFAMSGGAVGVPHDVGSALALLIHEIGTNAVKYGSLSVAEGAVRIDWTLQGKSCQLIWKELGGPPVPARLRIGFGSRLVDAAFPPDRGAASIAFEPDGVRCTVRFAVS